MLDQFLSLQLQFLGLVVQFVQEVLQRPLLEVVLLQRGSRLTLQVLAPKTVNLFVWNLYLLSAVAIRIQDTQIPII